MRGDINFKGSDSSDLSVYFLFCGYGDGYGDDDDDDGGYNDGNIRLGC